MPVLRVRRSLLFIPLFLAATALVVVSLLHLRFERTLRSTAAQLQNAHNLAFTFGPLRLPPNPGFAPVLSPANLRSAVHLDDHLFLAGPGELLEFTEAGAPVRTFRTGLELPGFPITLLNTGRLHTATPQLLIATAGAGLLMLNPGTGNLDQLLPAAVDQRDITAVAALPDGDLLLGTHRSGILRFNGEHLTIFRPELRNLAVTAILATADTVWIGTQSDGLYRHHAGVTQHLLPELPDPHIEALAASNNAVYAATPDGVVQFEDSQFARVLARDTFARALSADASTLTLASYEGGTTALPLTTSAHSAIAPAPQSDDAVAPAFLRLPDALYALHADGLYRQHGNAWSPVLQLPSATLADANIAALGFDPDNRLWIGYFDHGLDVLEPYSPTANPTAAHHLEDDHLFCINRIATDPRRNTVAVATANGLVLFDHAGKPRQVLTRKDGLINEHVTDIAFTPESMTLATPAGLTFVSDTGVESLYAFQGLVNNHVYSVTASPDGQLLAGTLGGLSLLSHATVRTNLTAANSHLRHNWISAVAPMPAFAGGGFLLGTYGGGLMQLTPAGQINAMPGAPPDAVINPNALLATPAHLFAGSLGQGLYVFGRTSRRWQPVAAGLPSLNVTALTARNGELYVGTDNGLVHIREAQLPQ